MRANRKLTVSAIYLVDSSLSFNPRQRFDKYFENITMQEAIALQKYFRNQTNYESGRCIDISSLVRRTLISSKKALLQVLKYLTSKVYGPKHSLLDVVELLSKIKNPSLQKSKF